MNQDRIRELLKNSKTYRKVLDHRRSCAKWGKEFCMKCFGNGLTEFCYNLEEEVNQRRRNKKCQ